MADFKMNTGEVLLANLNAMQYAFESQSGGKNSKNQELFRQAAAYLPVTKMDKGSYYRARIIQDCDGEDKGIFRKNGVPISGYNSQYSGVAPESKIKENGRANRKGEAVLYIAEDEETACKEQKPQESDYLSVAECVIDCDIEVLDFTVDTSKNLNTIFAEDVVSLFKDKYAIGIDSLYLFISNYFTSPNFKDMNYDTTLNFLDIVKQRGDISGIKYKSFYTKKCNIALWDDNKYRKCTDGKVKLSSLYK